VKITRRIASGWGGLRKFSKQANTFKRDIFICILILKVLPLNPC
jgi:hypothetical protein